MESKDYFDKKKRYDQVVAPIVEQLKEVLEREEIPYYMTFCLKNSADDTTFQAEGVSAEAYGIELADDEIKEHIKVSAGFKAVMGEKPVSMSINMGGTTVEF